MLLCSNNPASLRGGRRPTKQPRRLQVILIWATLPARTTVSPPAVFHSRLRAFTLRAFTLRALRLTLILKTATILPFGRSASSRASAAIVCALSPSDSLLIAPERR